MQKLRVALARLKPRRQTLSIGMYSHVRDLWGIFHAQPLILNDQRRAGAAIEGIVRHEEIEITQLAVDTHLHTDFAMALAKLLGFDLCPRLKALKDRHLFTTPRQPCREAEGGYCMSNQNRPEILLFIGDQNTPRNQKLARPTLAVLGKYTFPLP